MHRILIVDDELTMLKGIHFHLQENKNYEIFTASDREAAIKLIHENELDLVVSDLMLPQVEDGLTVIKTARDQWYEPSILAMSAFETVENAVSTMQAGADDFVSKGFGIDELSMRIENLLKKKQQLAKLSIENRILKETIQHHFSDFKIIGKSSQILGLLDKVQKVAKDARATCLIEGESGTGKDLIARTIHTLSPRRHAPFVPINCASIPENLIESELFGHEKGAFTGAYTTRQGKFEHANGGVIFLDEIGELPPSLQVSLLRVLEERSFNRVGGKRIINVDVMVIAASNKNLIAMVNNGEFRDDLYFRLNVVNIHVPPLRERRDDIDPLAQFFLEKFNLERKKSLKFSRKALDLLKIYDFPGNVRELRNIIEDAFIFSEGNWIKPEDLPIANSRHPKILMHHKTHIDIQAEEAVELTHREALEAFEKRYFVRLLEIKLWNLKEAAKTAGLSREWLSKKVHALGLKKREA
jgi:two-component system NtrC family response regulator